ncbi:4494_t:CDS:2 [Cetraspora pellucida]|uniref:4494_t:CDS:1 n=1 Tax=Cetraspora pellucida TaxID=1433469 RepID=A0A9N9AEX9_9GLOM|nr:4494_t:CDS:2 [Cetraspora pellucida]
MEIRALQSKTIKEMQTGITTDQDCIGWVFTDGVCLFGVNRMPSFDICTYPTFNDTPK